MIRFRKLREEGIPLSKEEDPFLTGASRSENEGAANAIEEKDVILSDMNEGQDSNSGSSKTKPNLRSNRSIGTKDNASEATVESEQTIPCNIRRRVKSSWPLL
jgi:hypothetical protein